MTKATLSYQDKLPITSDYLLKKLRDNSINFKLFEHKAIYSVLDSKSVQELIFPINSNSVHIKNLYLRDKKKNNFLFTCEQDKKINLKLLKEQIKSDRLSFGSPDRLFQNLGVLPGAVSPFCMLNGVKNNVKFYCDKELTKFKKIFLHPFVNDRTIYLDLSDLEIFLKKHHININWVNLK